MESYYRDYLSGQHEDAYDVWREIMKKYPPKRIVDLGTAEGGFSLFLLEEFKPSEFYTYDNRKYYKPKELDEYFEQLDIFMDIAKIGEIIRKEGRTVLFCDNGKKVLEFRWLFPYLKKGDIIAAHDWDSEIRDKDVKEFLPHLEEIHRDVTVTKLVFFIKK